MPNDHEHAVCGEVLITRLRRQAESASQVSKMVAEAKSRRQDDGSRSDLYSWSTPEQTLEYQAAECIAALTAEVEQQKAALNKIADLGSCASGKVPAHKLLQQAIDIATGAL